MNTTHAAVINIDPNLRVEHNWTIVDSDDIRSGNATVGAVVKVQEPSCGMVGEGEVMRIDPDGLIYLRVAWSGIVIDESAVD